MRLALTTFVLSSVFYLFSSVAAVNIRPHALAHRKHPTNTHSTLSLRQHQEPRSLIDLCIALDVGLIADAASLLGLGLPLNLGANVDLCLCLKDLDIFLDTDINIKALVGLFGRNTVAAIIKALINTSPSTQHCTLPPHAHHTCHYNDPCHYDCDPHYVKNGDVCVCAPPYTTCNGVCGSFVYGCGSSIPQVVKARKGPVLTLADAKASCKGKTVCGVAGRDDTLSYECIDVHVAPDSCGGCLTPHPFHESDPVLRPQGEDCGAISHAKEVGCSDGRCMIRRCKDDMVPSLDKDKCIHKIKPSTKLRMRKRRADLSPVNTSTTTTEDSDLVTKIVAAVKLVHDLIGFRSLLPPADETNPASSPGALPLVNTNIIDSLVSATADLLAARDMSALNTSINALVDLNALLTTTFGACGCTDTLHLLPLVELLDRLTASALDLQSWCSTNPIVSRQHSKGESDSAEGPSSHFEELPIIVGLSDLLAELGLSGIKFDLAVGGLGTRINDPLNNILSGLGVGPNNSGKRDDIHDDATPATLDAGLNVNLDTLLDFLGAFQDDISTLSSSQGSLFLNQSGLVTDILEATKELFHSSSTSAFISAVKTLVGTAKNAQGILESCNCTSKLGLSNILDDVVAIVDIALEIDRRCDLIQSGNDSNPLVVVGLNKLLAKLGLGGINSVITIGGLGPTLSETTDNLMNGFGIGSHGVKRHMESSIVDADATVAPDLLAKLIVLANVAVDLNGLSTLLTDPSNASSSQYFGLLDTVIQAIFNILGAPTTSSLVSSIAHLVATGTHLQNELNNCGCVDNLGLRPLLTNIVFLVNHALDLQSWCATHSIVSPSSGSSNSTSPPSTPNSSNEPIVIGLDKFLTKLGLGNIRVDAAIGLLDSDTNNSINNLLDGLAGIGPSGLSPPGHSTPVNAGTTVDADVLAKIYSLIDLIINLNNASTSAGASLTGIGSSSSSSSAANSNLVSDIVQVTIDLLSASSVSTLSSSVDHLVNVSSVFQATLAACQCVETLNLGPLVDVLAEVVDAALDLQSRCHSHLGMTPSGDHDSSSSSLSPEPPNLPIVLGLTKLLQGLGLSGSEGGVALDGLGSNINTPVNALLNGLSLGSNSLRRRARSRRRLEETS